MPTRYVFQSMFAFDSLTGISHLERTCTGMFRTAKFEAMLGTDLNTHVLAEEILK